MGRSGAQRSVAGLEGNQTALSFSSLKSPTIKVLKAAGLSDQALAESSAEQGFSAESNLDPASPEAHISGRPQRVREL
jgi:hypothetical protein